MIIYSLYCFTIGADNMTILWNSATESQLICVEFPNLVSCLSFNKIGSKLAVCCKDGLTRIMDPRTGNFTVVSCHSMSEGKVYFIKNCRLIVFICIQFKQTCFSG